MVRLTFPLPPVNERLKKLYPYLIVFGDSGFSFISISLLLTIHATIYKSEWWAILLVISAFPIGIATFLYKVYVWSQIFDELRIKARWI
jgi:hypothetical protein